MSPFGVLNLVMALLFLVCVLLQYNDPDPVRWMALYGGAAAACLVSWRKPAAWLPAAVVGAVALGWAAMLAPNVLPGFHGGDLFRSMKADTPQVELGREMLGLAIAGAWMAVLVVLGVRPRAPRRA